jgi:peptidoglycan/LPS O-acetylase OafA/YrhL
MIEPVFSRLERRFKGLLGNLVSSARRQPVSIARMRCLAMAAKSRYAAGMGFIRLFLALSVMLWHMPCRNFSALDGGVAVLMFFILSGFYMALTINENFYGQPGWRKRFYLSRTFRLYPAYFTMLAATVLWAALTHVPDVFLGNAGVPLPGLLGLQALNILLLGQDVFKLVLWAGNYPGGQHLNHSIIAAMPAHFFENRWMVLPQAWTLGSELLFYPIAPFIVRSLPRILVFLGISLCIRWGLIFGGHGFMSELWGYRFFPATLCFFLLGSLSYHFYRRIRNWTGAARAGGGIFVAFVGFAVVSMLRWHGILLAPDFATGYDSLQAWAGYLIFAAALPCMFCCWRKSLLDRMAGELSYPLYLAHELVITLVFAKIPGGQTEKELAAFLLCGAAAAALFMLVDRPVAAWRHRQFSEPKESGRFFDKNARVGRLR